ncbi:unnamed protein product [Alopecurus aequalis]
MERLAKARSDMEHMLLDETEGPKVLPLPLLEDITNNFSADHEIGDGGFAVVYKGILENGTVAVKKLSSWNLDENKFKQEIECLMKVKHQNIVRFLGYCCDTQGELASFEGERVMAGKEERLLCFEYVPKGDLRGFISDASSGLEWRDRYKIIKGICEGLHYLHNNHIIHLDLKPANILMDDKMVPKIADFGLSRCFKEDQTHATATKVAGTFGYLAPESHGRKITPKYDFYSLGVIIIEIMTGDRGYQDIKTVVESWNNRLDMSKRKQVRVCIELAFECTEFNPAKRPFSTQHIIDRLDETETTYIQDILDVYIIELCFPSKPNADEQVVFRLLNKSMKPWQCFASIPLYGIVPSMSTYMVVVTAEKQERLPEETDYHLILQSSIQKNKNIRVFKERSRYGYFFEESINLENMVHEVALKTIFSSQGKTTSENQQIISVKNTNGTLCCLDAQSDVPWIITGHQHGDVCIWNYGTQRKISSLNISKESVMPSYLSRKVHSVKAISRQKWFVAGTSDGVIHVYNCDTKVQKIRSFRAASNGFITSMAVHPTQPYVLSSANRDIKLWNWKENWECTQSFVQEHSSTICQVAFNLKDTNIFASASDDHTVKVWSIDSRESMYTLSGHFDKVNCLDFFACDDQHYLISGSDDCTAKVWDMKEKACIHTMEAFVSPIISAIAFVDRPHLITGSKDGSIHLWSSSDFRLERIVNFGSGGAIMGLGRLMGSRRIVIGQEYAVSNMDIDKEEPIATEDSNESSI